MRFPSKVTSYKESIISKFPIILSFLKSEKMSLLDLYRKTKSKVSDVKEFIEILDCLYILEKIDLEENGVIYYVDGSDV